MPTMRVSKKTSQVQAGVKASSVHADDLDLRPAESRGGHHDHEQQAGVA